MVTEQEFPQVDEVLHAFYLFDGAVAGSDLCYLL
jgi:hypothetical protein